MPLYPQSPILVESGAYVSSGTTVRGANVTGSTETRYNFEFKTTLPETQFRALQALTRSQSSTGNQTEIVVYFLWDQHTDLGAQPTREPVPDLDPVLGTGTVSYYPVLQGTLVCDGVLTGHQNGEPCYAAKITFTEGTIRRP